MTTSPKAPLRVYIAGKITGLPIESAAAKFEKAENLLRDMGLEPVNPMKLPHNHDKTWESYMKECIKALVDCDRIYSLPCWIDSPGAMVEVQLAGNLNIPHVRLPQADAYVPTHFSV